MCKCGESQGGKRCVRNAPCVSQDIVEPCGVTPVRAHPAVGLVCRDSGVPGGAGHPVHTHEHYTHSQAVPQLLRVTRRPQRPEALLQGGHCKRRGRGQGQPGLHQAVPTRVHRPPCLCPGTWVLRLRSDPAPAGASRPRPHAHYPTVTLQQGPGPRGAQGLCGAASRGPPWVWGGGCRPPGASTL